MAAGQPTSQKVPGKSDLGSYLYVIEFSSGVVKVGMTTSPAVRFTRHEKVARSQNASIGSYWISPPHVSTAANERALLNSCRRRAKSIGASEYFAGLVFAEAVELARSLKFEPRSAEQRDARAEKSRAAIRGRASDFGRLIRLPPPMIRSDIAPATGAVDDKTNRLICDVLDLHPTMADHLDEEDREAVLALLIDFRNAEADALELELWLEQVRSDAVHLLTDRRTALASALSAKHRME